MAMMDNLVGLTGQVLTLERAIASDLEQTAEHVAYCPPAGALLASLDEELDGMPSALEGALQRFGGTSTSGAVNVRSRFSGADGSASGALASLSGRLTQVALMCGTLHAVAHRAYESTGDGNVADLAEGHMLAYLTAAAAIGEVLSDIAVWELEQAGSECDCRCSSCSVGICLCARHGRDTVAKAREKSASRATDEGIVVRQPRNGSSAALAELHPEDVIIAVAEQAIAGPLDLQRAIRDLPAGSNLSLTVRRGENTRRVALMPA